MTAKNLMTGMRNNLTNQHLTDHFASNFELVSHAIDIARSSVASGREIKLDPAIRNEAYQVLVGVALEAEGIKGKEYSVPVKTVAAPKRVEAQQAEATEESGTESELTLEEVVFDPEDEEMSGFQEESMDTE